MPVLTLSLLGKVRLSVEGQDEIVLRSQRALQLLAYLAIHGAARMPRAQAAFLLWPDSSEAQAHTNLRKLLHQLRAELPLADRVIDTGSAFIGTCPGAVALDVAAFEGALNRATRARRANDLAAEQYALEVAVEAYSGDLLPGFYEEWVLEERERLQSSFIGALQRLARLYEMRHYYPEAIQALLHLRAVDPLIEETYRQLMRLYSLTGSRAEALRVYQDCVDSLGRLLGVVPDPMTQKAYDQLMQQASTPRFTGPMSLAGWVRLVGRQREWEALTGTWSVAAAGAPRMAVVSGEAGIGKTRLLEELAEWARQMEIDVAQAACYEAEGELAFSPVGAWLRARPLPAVESAWLAETARILPELAARRPDLAPPAQLPETWQRSRLYEALARVILAGRAGLILVLDDLHWCDRETLEWLRYLLRFDPRARLLVVCALRPEECAPESYAARLLDALRRAGQLAEIPLAPLSVVETGQLCDRMTHGEVSPERAALLYRETEGNPLFILEMLRAGILPARPGSPPGSSPLPPGMQTVIASRLARVSPLARELAGYAAAIGSAFTYEHLREVSGFDELPMAQALEELLQCRVLREKGPDRCDFNHDKIREVAYGNLSAVRRRLYHRRAAEALERLYADHLDAASAQIALHYEHAGLAERAEAFRRRASRFARSSHILPGG